MSLRIRLATSEDIPLMHQIRTSVTENMLSDSGSLQHADYFPFLGEIGETWVGEIAGTMAGFGAVDLIAHSVWALFVAPQFEAKGVGKALLAKLIAQARMAGLMSLELSTTSGTRAEVFYTRQGWKLVGNAPNGEVRFCYAL